MGYMNVGSFWIGYSQGYLLLLSYEYCKSPEEERHQGFYTSPEFCTSRVGIAAVRILIPDCFVWPHHATEDSTTSLEPSPVLLHCRSRCRGHSASLTVAVAAPHLVVEEKVSGSVPLGSVWFCVRL
ncbi:hypothetical protein MRB53_021340 [Persea americana]|uniref:Uncharacterized protein n=1 Tax=Persea americana TaxID=3435 RepID=A0ACC2L4R8_PERAE|nr:hypothetical protein MRB53_021340 [Persea americana]